MGAEQSQQPGQNPIRKTETANFDFRYERPSLENKSPRSQGSSQRNTWEGNKSPQSKERIDSSSKNDNSYYWLEVGTDVVKRI